MEQIVIVAILALAVGLLVGWLAASRRTGSLAAELAVAQSRAADANLARQARDAVERERNEAMREAASTSRSSPAPCPRESLTTLKSSRSR